MTFLCAGGLSKKIFKLQCDPMKTDISLGLRGVVVLLLSIQIL